MNSLPTATAKTQNNLRSFGSDNHATVHPKIIQAMIEANEQHMPSYGTDSYTLECQHLFKNLFTNETEAHFVFNGTAANVLALQCCMQSYESAFVCETSHLNLDECGAPEKHAGKLIPIPSKNGKIIFSELNNFYVRLGDQHFSQPRVISLTQPTEYGTVYSLTEIKDICDWAHTRNMFVHIDGARFANALYYLNCTAKQMTTDLGVDILSWGGTKNGLMFGEAVVIFNPKLKKSIKYLRKQLGQLPSKSRFIASQFQAYLSNDHYLHIAQKVHHLALMLSENLKQFSSLKITQPVQSNAVFVLIPQHLIKVLRKKYFFYVWNETTFECRLMLSWDNTEDDIQGFIELLHLNINSK